MYVVLHLFHCFRGKGTFFNQKTRTFYNRPVKKSMPTVQGDSIGIVAYCQNGAKELWIKCVWINGIMNSESEDRESDELVCVIRWGELGGCGDKIKQNANSQG